MAGLLALCALALPSEVTAADKPKDKPPAGTPACVSYTAEAVYRGIGYEHLVHIGNACQKLVACTVTTNVNPDPIYARVAAKGTATLLTFRGSPASTFVANVSCKLE